MEQRKENELRTRLHSRSQGFRCPKMSLLGSPYTWDCSSCVLGWVHSDFYENRLKPRTLNRGLRIAKLLVDVSGSWGSLKP